jgi:hypothetical protein
MSGKIATVIDLKTYLQVRGVKPLHGSAVETQHISEGKGYLIVSNRLKAHAEEDFAVILDAYQGVGGKEYEVTDLTVNEIPAPEMKGITNDAVPYVEYPRRGKAELLHEIETEYAPPNSHFASARLMRMAKGN